IPPWNSNYSEAGFYGRAPGPTLMVLGAPKNALLLTHPGKISRLVPWLCQRVVQPALFFDLKRRSTLTRLMICL
ncbi:MAG: hypothetical protein IJR68_01545, partial [Fretibacterium sp.]|nr:hypothetical protein [Fretibacterium sp.]